MKLLAEGGKGLRRGTRGVAPWGTMSAAVHMDSAVHIDSIGLRKGAQAVAGEAIPGPSASEGGHRRTGITGRWHRDVQDRVP